MYKLLVALCFFALFPTHVLATTFEMKSKWIRKLKEIAGCISNAEARTVELPPNSSVNEWPIASSRVV